MVQEAWTKCLLLKNGVKIKKSYKKKETNNHYSVWILKVSKSIKIRTGELCEFVKECKALTLNLTLPNLIWSTFTYSAEPPHFAVIQET